MTTESAIATAITVVLLSIIAFFKWWIKKLLDKKFQKDHEINIAKNKKALITSRIM